MKELTFRPKCPLCLVDLGAVSRPEGILTSGSTVCHSCKQQVSFFVEPKDNKLYVRMVTLPLHSVDPGETVWEPLKVDSPNMVVRPERMKFASHRTASLPKISESESYNLIKYLEENFAHLNPKSYVFFLTPRELCDIAEYYSDEMIVKWSDKDCRLTAVSDVLVHLAWKAHPDKNSITVVGLYEFKTSREAKNVWFEKDVIVKGVPVESVLDIRGRYALNFQSGSYAIYPEDLVTITPDELWGRICVRCQSIGAPLD